MADRGVEYGIRITADGKVAIAESARVEKALDGVAQALDHVEASATQAQPAIGATMKQFAPQPAVDTAKALGNAAGKFDQVQMSAAQTSAALRQLPMQFTDIFTSLAAGMPPMQVALQQGGQLKDAFGGIGPAAKAMGGYVMGLVTPLTVAAAGAGVLAMAFLKGRDEGEEYRKTLALTGNAAGVTADQLAQMAARLDVVSGTQASNANILTRLAATGQVAKGQIEGVAGAISAMTEAGISDADALVKAFADIGKDPVKAILKVNEAYNFLTPTIYGQIKALQDQGKQEEAVALAQETAAKAMKDRAREVVDQTGTLERAWKSVTTSAREAWDAMLSIGREKTLQQKIADQKKVIEDIRDGLTPGRIDMAQDYLAQLEAQAGAQQKAAQAGADGAKNMREYLDVESKVAPIQKKGAEQTRTLAQALKEYRDNLVKLKELDPTNAMLKPEAIAKGEAALREQYKPKTTGTRSTRKDQPDDARVIADWERRVALLDAQAASTDKLSDTERAYVRVLSDISSGHLNVTVAGRKRLAVDAARALAQDEANRQAAEQIRQAAEQAKWADALAKDTTRQTAQLEEQLKREQEQVAAIGLTKDAVERLAAERLRNEAAAKAEYAANLELAAQYAGPLADAYRAAAEEARKQADLLNQRAENRIEGANREAAAATAKQWDKIADDIERSLTDSLYRGFESGKNMGKAFVDSLRNTLKTAALKVAVQTVAQPITSGLSGWIGANGTSNGSGGIGGLGNLVSTGTQLAGMTGLSAYTGAAGYMQLGSMASSFSTGMSAAAAGTDLSAAIAAYEAAGMGATAGSIGAGASAAGALGSSAGAVSSVLGAAMAAAPYLAAAILIAQYLGAFDGPTYHHGGAYLSTTEGGFTKANDTNLPDFNLNWGAYTVDRAGGFDDAMLAISGGIAKQINQSVTRYGGKTSSMTVGARFASDNDDWSEGAIRVFNQAGQAVFDFSRRYTKDSTKALEEFGQDSVRALLATLQNADLTDEYQALFSTLDPVKASVAEITALFDRAEAIQQEVAAVRDAIDANFLGPAEQLKVAFERMGLAVPATLEGYEQLVRAQDLNGAAGRQMAAALMGTVGLWKEAQAASTAAAEDAKRAAEAAQRAAEEQAAALMEAVTSARADLVSAYQDEVSALDSTVSRFRQFSTDLRRFRDGLTLGGLSPYTPEQRYAEASRQFEKTYSAAMAGDETAIGQLQGVATAFLEASQTYNASGVGYLTDFARVQAALSDAAISAAATADVAQVQLDVARSQLSALGQIDNSVKTVAQAIAGLSTAVMAAIAQGINPGLANVSALTGGAPDQWVAAGAGMSAWQSLGGATATKTPEGISVQGLNGKMHSAGDLVAYWGSGISERQIYDSARFLGITLRELDDFMGWKAGTATRWAIDQGLPAFATGGDHAGGLRLVGERGPEIEATGPARYWSFEQSRQMLSGGDSGLLAEVRALREEVRALRAQQQSETAAVIEGQFRAAERNADVVATVRSRERWSAATRPEVV